MLYQFGKNSVVSRTYYVCISKALKFEGFEGGTPKMSTIESESYVTTNPKDMAAAKRMVKRADKSILLETIEVEVIASEVIALSNEQFIAHGESVNRSANGRVS